MLEFKSGREVYSVNGKIQRDRLEEMSMKLGNLTGKSFALDYNAKDSD